MAGGYSRGRNERRRSSSSSSSSSDRDRKHSSTRRDNSRERDAHKAPSSRDRRSPRRRSPSPKRGRRSPRRRSGSPARQRRRTPPPQQMSSLMMKTHSHRASPPRRRSPGRRHSPPRRKISPARRGASPGRRGASPGRRAASPGRQPSPRRPSPAMRRHSSPGRLPASSQRAPSPAHRGPSPGRQMPGRQAGSPGRRGASPSRRPSSPSRRGPSPPRRALSPPRRGPSPSRRAPSPPRRGPSPSQRGPSPFRRAPSPTRRSPSPPRRAASPGKRAASPGHRRSSPGRLHRSRSRSPIVRDRRPVIHEAESTTSRDPAHSESSHREPLHRESSIAQHITLMSQEGAARRPSPERRRRTSPERGRKHSPERRRRSPERSRKERSRSPVRRKSEQWPQQSPMQETDNSARWGHHDSDMRYPAKSQMPQVHDTSKAVPADRYGDQDDRQRAQYEGGTESVAMLSQRFTSYGLDSSKSFFPKDNITVGIERNITSNSPVRRRDLQPHEWAEVRVLRPKEADQKPLFLREEFKCAPEDFTERRVIRVEDSSSSSYANLRISSGKVERENFEVRRRSSSGHERPSLSERWRGSDTREDTLRVRDSRDNVEIIRRIDGHSSSSRHADKDERLVSDSRRVRGASPPHQSDRDERLVSRRSNRDDDPRDRKEKFKRVPGDLRHNLARRRSDPNDTRKDSRDLRQRLGDRKSDEDLRRRDRDEGTGIRSRLLALTSSSARESKKELPDFSRRPDRYVNDDWKEKPELIPKGASYYEHDNREHDDAMFFRGRGRGFRGRGFRGGFRGRGRARGARSFNRNDSEVWTHDKFKDMDDEADKEPSSTTETK